MHSAMATYSGSGPEPFPNRRRSFQPRSDNIEIPTFLRQTSPVVSLESEESMKGGGVYVQLSQTDSEVSHSSSLKNSLGNIGLGHNLNVNTNNNTNNNDSTDITLHHPPLTRRSTSPGMLTRPSLTTHTKANIRLRSDSTMPIVKRYMPVKTSDGPNLPVMQKSMSLPRSHSSDDLAADVTAAVGGNLQRKKSSSMELLESETSISGVAHRNKSRKAGKPPLHGKHRPSLKHQSSSPILDTSKTSQKSDDSFWFEYGCV